jgi:hypothetical protein
MVVIKVINYNPIHDFMALLEVSARYDFIIARFLVGNFPQFVKTFIEFQISIPNRLFAIFP